MKVVMGWALKGSVNGIMHSTTQECIGLLEKALSFHYGQVTLCQRNFSKYRHQLPVPVAARSKA